MVNSYAAVDLETTGLTPKLDKIIEIGALRVEDGEVTGRYETLVNPGVGLDDRVAQLTGITDHMLAHAPIISEVIQDVVNFCGSLPLLGHHIIFDYSFLKKACINQGLEYERDGIDTLFLCRSFMPADQKKNLEAASAWFGVSQEHPHRAACDADCAHRLYQALASRYGRIKPEAFEAKPLIYRVKREQPATKRQKEYLRDLIKYHRINVTAQIDLLTRNEVSRMVDRIVSQYGGMRQRKTPSG